MIRILAFAAALLTVCITASSAFIRHVQNGVGCADWPACYRTAPAAAATTGAAAAAAATTGDLPGVRSARALHRVSATAVGVLVLAVTVLGWTSLPTSGRLAAVLAVTVTAFLAWLGRYTPHDLPLVTLGNLGGGLLLAAALGWVAAALRHRDATVGASDSRRSTGTIPSAAAAISRAAIVGLALVALVAWTGAMIGARHAIAACAAPLCVGGAQWSSAALDPLQASPTLGAGAGPGLHLAHRFAALGFVVTAALLAWRLRAARRRLAAWLVVLVVAQVVAGAATVMGGWPLGSATLHNVLAALLAMTLGIAAGGAARARAGMPGPSRG